MGDQPEDAPAVENPPPPVNPPIQPIQPVNSLPLPSKFEGANNPNQADMWPKWLRHFERYRIASGLQNKSNQEQVGTSLYAMGDCTHDIVKTKHPLLLTKSKPPLMVILQPAEKGKTPLNPWTPLFKTYTASPKIVSTVL